MDRATTAIGDDADTARRGIRELDVNTYYCVPRAIILDEMLVERPAGTGRGAVMSELVRFELEGNASVLIEVDETGTLGLQRVGRGQDGIVETGRRLSDALAGVREAAQESIRMLRSLSPDECELEFGVKFAGEAGAVIAKTSTEGHFVVKLSWARRNLAADGDE